MAQLGQDEFAAANVGKAASVDPEKAVPPTTTWRGPRASLMGIDIRGTRAVAEAAVDAGVAAAKRAGQLTAGHVIARPHRFTEAIIPSGDNKVVRALAD